MDQALSVILRIQHLLEELQYKVHVQQACHAPAFEALGEGINDERGIGKTRPGCHMDDIGYTKLIQLRGRKLPLHAVLGRSDVAVTAFSLLGHL